MTFAELLREVKRLSPDEQQQMMTVLKDEIEQAKQPAAKRSLRDFRGIGAHLADGIDAQEHVNQIRTEWDERP